MAFLPEFPTQQSLELGVHINSNCKQVTVLKRSWKILAVLSAALLIFVLILALAPQDNVWIEAKRSLEARGEVLEWDKIVPAKVPPEKNFFEHPVAASLLPMKGKPAPDNPLDVPSPRLPPGTESLGIPFVMSQLVALPRESTTTNQPSLIELQKWFKQWDESFAQLRAAGNRPFARLPGDYTAPWDSPIPNFVAARQLVQVLGSRAKVHLLLGDSRAAFEDLETLNVVMKSFEAQPGTLVMSMIHVAIAGLYLDTFEDGLRQKLWARSELQQLIPRLVEMNLLKVVEQGIRSERIGVLRTLDALAARRRDPLYARSLEALTSGEWTVERLIIQFSPPSWVRKSQATYAGFIQEYLDSIDFDAKAIDAPRLATVNAEVAKLRVNNPKNTLLGYVTPNFSKAAATMAKTQNRASQLALAAALQIFYADYGAYPLTLTELVPNLISDLPEDVFTGELFFYRPLAERFELSDPKTSPQTIVSSTFIWNSK